MGRIEFEHILLTLGREVGRRRVYSTKDLRVLLEIEHVERWRLMYGFRPFVKGLECIVRLVGGDFGL